MKPFKEHESLGNFERGWDFSRFAYLLENLRDDVAPMPSQKEVKAAVNKCRMARNKGSHIDHDPRNHGKTDYELVTLVEDTRKWLPKINDLQVQDAKALYERLNR